MEVRLNKINEQSPYAISYIWHNFLEFWILYALQLCIVWLYKYFDMSVTDESFVDETRVWRTKL